MANKHTCGITPENINELQSNEIFVFGSNLAGEHGGGAARFAYKKFGAIWGQGVGLQGSSYALPTLDRERQKIGIRELEQHVETLYAILVDNQRTNFLITKVGCGIAGFTIAEIAPLFKPFMSLSNCSLPIEFIELNQ